MVPTSVGSQHSWCHHIPKHQRDRGIPKADPTDALYHYGTRAIGCQRWTQNKPFGRQGQGPVRLAKPGSLSAAPCLLSPNLGESAGEVICLISLEPGLCMTRCLEVQRLPGYQAEPALRIVCVGVACALGGLAECQALFPGLESLERRLDKVHGSLKQGAQVELELSLSGPRRENRRKSLKPPPLAKAYFSGQVPGSAF